MEQILAANTVVVSPKGGNRCGHNPKRPNLMPLDALQKDKGRLPYLLERATEKALEWYQKPYKCKPLLKGKDANKPMRSERREACLRVLRAIFETMELASLQLGTPTLDGGFIDVSMAQLTARSGLKKRRCERAIAELIRAGFLTTKRRSGQNEQGKYFGLRSIRTVQVALFEWLGLDKRLAKESKKASARLKERALKAHRPLRDFFRRVCGGMANQKRRAQKKNIDVAQKRKEADIIAQLWRDNPEMSAAETHRRVQMTLN